MTSISLLSEALRVLYVGHSLVSPTLPQMVSAALPAGSEVEYQVINGAPLEWNWDHHSEAEGVDGRAVLKAERFDAVVLTERVPLKGTVPWHNTAAVLADWTELAQTNGPTEVWLYETWTDIRSGTGFDPQDEDSKVPWRERLVSDRAIWAEVAREASAQTGIGIGLIPAGGAMARLSDAIAAGEVPGVTEIGEFYGDGIHLNGLGFWFITMVHVAALTGESPEGLPRYLGERERPTQEQVAVLQRIAWEAVQEGTMPPAP